MTDRGQLIVLASAVVAVALIPVLVASIHVTTPSTAAVPDNEFAEVEQVLQSRVTAIAGDLPLYAWGQRANASQAMRDGLSSTLASLGNGTGDLVYNVTYAPRTARAVSHQHCPHGVNQRFGACTAINGIVLQNRVGTTHVVAVAITVTVRGPRGTQRVTVLIEPRPRISDDTSNVGERGFSPGSDGSSEHLGKSGWYRIQNRYQQRP